MKFYFCPIATVTEKNGSSYAPGIGPSLAVTGDKAVVGTDDDQFVAPNDYLYIGESADLAKLVVSDSVRALMTSYFGLTQDVRAYQMGGALWEAKTLCAPDLVSTLEPAESGFQNLWFDNKLIHRKLLVKGDEAREPVLVKKQTSYDGLRTNAGVPIARRWLPRQNTKGFEDEEIQGEKYRRDGGGLRPTTTIEETGVPDQTWSPISTGIEWYGTFWQTTSTQFAGAICATPVAEGDHYAQLDWTNGDDRGVGPMVRVQLGIPSNSYCYYLTWQPPEFPFPALWSLRRAFSNNLGSYQTVGQFGRETAIDEGYAKLTADGSDLICEANGETATFSDSGAPDSHLYGGFFSRSASIQMQNWLMVDSQEWPPPSAGKARRPCYSAICDTKRDSATSPNWRR